MTATATAARTDCADSSDTPGVDAVTDVKLWRNPCWLAYRFNFLALHYNAPLYGYVERRYGLIRPEFVVIYSLGLIDGALARDIASSSGFPKNTLSRAIRKLSNTGLIRREVSKPDKRCHMLWLTPAGRAIFDEALPRFVAFEQRMLQTLTKSERDTLSGLLAKIVHDSTNWPSEPEQPDADN